MTAPMPPAESKHTVRDVSVRMLRGGLSSSGLGSNWIITREMRRACRENDIRTSMLKLALRFPIKCTEWLDTAV